MQQLTLFDETKYQSIKAKPVVKWPGGKSKLAPEIIQRIPKTCINYIEPFLGGASVLLEAIAQRPKMRFVASDINFELFNFYLVVKIHPDRLIELLQSWHHSEDFFYRIRKWDREEKWQDKYTSLERAARFLYLNKCGFNGLQRVNSRGENNVSFGNYKNPKFCDEQNIRAFSKAIQSTTIYPHSWEGFVSNASREDFIYCDPPYHNTFARYSGSFGERSQEKLAKYLREASDRGVLWIASNSDTEFIRSLYSGFKIEQRKMSRSISCNGKKRESAPELLISNF